MVSDSSDQLVFSRCFEIECFFVSYPMDALTGFLSSLPMLFFVFFRSPNPVEKSLTCIKNGLVTHDEQLVFRICFRNG